MSKRIFISDIHMGPRRTQAGPRHGYDWLNDTEKDVLLGFLKHLHDKEDNLTELVLAGDVLDNWICPHDEKPPSFDEIFAAHPEIVGSIKALLSKGVSVIFVEGNHDMYLSQEDLNAAFGDHANLTYEETYDKDGVYAAHGHSFDPCNSRDAGALYNFPLGYFISRMVATNLAMTDAFRKPTYEIIKECVGALVGGESLGVAVFDTILKDAKLDDGITFLMPDGNTVTTDEVRTAYTPVKPNTSIKDLRPKADSLSKARGDIKVVIFGHTHKELSDGLELLDEDDPFTFRRIYANSGTWSESLAPNYIEIEPEAKDKYDTHVRLMAWKSGAPYKIDNKFIKT